MKKTKGCKNKIGRSCFLSKAWSVAIIAAMVTANTADAKLLPAFHHNDNSLRSVSLTKGPGLPEITGSLRRAQRPAKRVSNFKFKGLQISLDQVEAEVKIDDNRAVLTNQDGYELIIESLAYRGEQYLKVGNATYLVRRRKVNLSDINPVGNVAWFYFFGKDPVHVAEGNYSFNLPILGQVCPLEQFPASRVLHPALVAPRPSRELVDTYRKTLATVYAYVLKHKHTRRGVYGDVFSLMHMVATVSESGRWQDYYLGWDVLNQALKLRYYKDYKKQIIALSDHLFFSYIGCNWKKWKEIRQDLKAGKQKAAAVGRKLSLYERPIEQIRLNVPEEQLKNWKIVTAEALTDEDVKYIPTEKSQDRRSQRAFSLGSKSVNKGRAGAIPFAGGAATNVKMQMGAHKMTHDALKVKVMVREGKRWVLEQKARWISIIQASLGLILGKDPSTKVAVVTSVAGTLEGESERSIRNLLEQCYEDEVKRKQINVVMQRAGLVLDPKSGEPLTFKDGRLAACAENHLWAFLAALMNKDLIIELLKTTDGIVTTGNGDNILNYPKEGLVGRILQARQEKDPLATIGVCAPSAGDRKGGFAVKITYQNIETGEIIEQVEFREVSEFPTRLLEADSEKTVYDAINLSKEKESQFYEWCEKNGLFIEDLFDYGKKRVAFNISFYTVDLRLLTARIFGLNENDENLVDELEKKDEQEWIDTIADIGEKVPRTVVPNKKVPNEDNTDTVYGYMTEQTVQDFIVNALAFLSREELKRPRAEILLGERKDVFLPYKGLLQDVLDMNFKSIIDRASGKAKQAYDLFANARAYTGAIKALAKKGHYIHLDKNTRVAAIIPPESLDEIIAQARKKEQLIQFHIQEALRSRMPGGPVLVPVPGDADLSAPSRLLAKIDSSA